MLIKHPADVAPSDITPRAVFDARRDFMRSSAIGIGAALLGAGLPDKAHAVAARGKTLGPLVKSPYSTDEKLNDFDDITSYCNFYEFGTDKSDPARHAHRMATRPWTVSIEGLVHKPKTLDIDDILKVAPLEERIYRLRCVEAWSMVVPWVGIPMSALLRQVEPLGGAKYVEFVTHLDPKEMPGTRRQVLDWPYVEGLRLDEAMHPLTIAALGLYGEVMPNQNGAPIRLIVPWKYGFKSAKSIVRIRFTDKEPLSSWTKSNGREYGFYSNVNPEVDHPRWSQERERRIGEFIKRKTLKFNGYGDQVASLYTGMDLKKHF
ncbi:MAG: protein-methionine-sulfoxide reductase catalytic subunit MsrP [Gammaproteobacteria bacterium]|jgi:methionine sulfoxide reductase catalytic subunit|nr:protein-methionine-sulfoxide reductase catalytic subunit MsrP [Gammaproteobacteria bacterium]MBU0858227.1 protein-methionine-sulfoxide reductase catalytic subunit MsrP [Gammaproteobacteria bacterium]MBU1846531.1 protein-methionine-sulfoxide reductase catalytic subunit MsrP [Gammaproteobacteria bacterium]